MAAHSGFLSANQAYANPGTGVGGLDLARHVVRLPTPQRIRRLDVSLDARDRYRIELLAGGRSVAATAVGPPPVEGLIGRYITMHSRRDDIDAVQSSVISGDRRCALGHLRVFP